MTTVNYQESYQIVKRSPTKAAIRRALRLRLVGGIDQAFNSFISDDHSTYIFVSNADATMVSAIMKARKPIFPT